MTDHGKINSYSDGALPNHTPSDSAPAPQARGWQFRETCVYLPGGAGGFDLRGCPDPEQLAQRIAAAMNASTAAPQVQAPAKLYHFEQRSSFGPWIEVDRPTAQSVTFMKAAAPPQAPAKVLTDAARESALRKLTVASVIIGNLPELPGYNGSVLTIDDTEAAMIVADLDEAHAIFATPTPAPEAATAPSDALRLDWLDQTNKRFKMGWDVGLAPAGNCSVKVIIMGGKPIREAIDAAITAAKKGTP